MAAEVPLPKMPSAPPTRPIPSRINTSWMVRTAWLRSPTFGNDELDATTTFLLATAATGVATTAAGAGATSTRPRNFAVRSSSFPVALNPATFCSERNADFVDVVNEPVIPPLTVNPRAAIACWRRTTSGPESPKRGS